jgi:hypothetical protein
MTYPVDDLGNPRVDFVWGQFPLQPDDQRERTDQGGENITTDGNWTVTKERGSSFLNSGWTELSFGTGDGGNTRYQTFTWDSHTIATTGYNNFPEFLPNYAGDGDTGLEAVVPKIVGLTYPAAGPIITAAGFVDSGSTTTWVGATVANDGLIKTQSPAAGSIANVGLAISIIRYNAPEVPNLVGLTEAAATTALTNVHLVKGAVTTADNAAGATAINDGKIKTQSVAAGTTVDTGSSVALVKYAYTAVANPIAGFSVDSFPGHSALTGQEVYMFLLGRTVKPTSLSTILISGNSNSSLNRNWTVNTVEDNDSYNTGGTVCKLTAQGVESVDNPNTNVTVGTWFQL